jgi:hypothetical protein
MTNYLSRTQYCVRPSAEKPMNPGNKPQVCTKRRSSLNVFQPGADKTLIFEYSKIG